jgi:hypothetical protein
MKRIFLLIIACYTVFACSDDDNTSVGFSQEELSPVAIFTHNNKSLKISGISGASWTSSPALNEKGEEIPGMKTKGFGSTIDSSGNGYWFEVRISKWVNDDEVEYANHPFIEVVKPQTFKSIFTPGKRVYAKSNYTDEVLIDYSDENSTHWRSSYQGDLDSHFTIIRSMSIGTDSCFIEAKFKVRLYNNVFEYIDINDGYFKGYYLRRR